MADATKSAHDAIVLSDSRVLVTGGTGFLGQYVCDELRRRGTGQVISVGSRDHDLSQPDAAGEMIQQHRPDVVVHLAAKVGGIEANANDPAGFYYDNLTMGTHLLEACRRLEVTKFVAIGTICEYPAAAPMPLSETSLWEGFPSAVTAPYGIAKRALALQGQLYTQQYGMRTAHVIPTNLYGPGDNFDPASSHVVAALIRRCVEAVREGREALEVWGDGTATREFLHARDAARGIVDAVEHLEDPAPVNLGTGKETSIRELARAIVDAAAFEGELRWLTDKPTGTPRRYFDVGRARKLLGFEATIPLRAGIRETVDWWREQASAG